MKQPIKNNLHLSEYEMETIINGLFEDFESPNNCIASKIQRNAYCKISKKLNDKIQKLLDLADSLDICYYNNTEYFYLVFEMYEYDCNDIQVSFTNETDIDYLTLKLKKIKMEKRLKAA